MNLKDKYKIEEYPLLNSQNILACVSEVSNILT